MARIHPIKQELQAEFPNLLLATTYALNKSNSKRLCVGLEYSDGYYRERVKIITSGAGHRTVTIGVLDWALLKDQFETIGVYFDNDYAFIREFGTPSKTVLPRLEVNYSACYGVKSISIDETPINVDETKDEEGEEQPCKKRKITPPGVVMQQSTFEGLRAQSTLADLHLNNLTKISGKVNRAVDYIVEYLKNMLKIDDQEQCKILNDFKTFKVFYAMHNASINHFVSETMVNDEDCYKNELLDIILNEIRIYNLHVIFSALRNNISSTLAEESLASVEKSAAPAEEKEM